MSGLGPHCVCGCRVEQQESKGSTSIENAASDGEDDSQVTSDIPNKAANETLEGIEMSVDAIGLDARDRLVEDEDYEPELLQSDEKRLLDDDAGLLLDDGPEVLVGGRGDHVEDEDDRPSSSKGKRDGHAKGDDEVTKPDLPCVSWTSWGRHNVHQQ